VRSRTELAVLAVRGDAISGSGSPSARARTTR
jgi:hypothetical protein